jgi:hypothetical protein
LEQNTPRFVLGLGIHRLTEASARVVGLAAGTENRMVETGRKNKAPALPTDVQHKIGEKLKAIYDDVVRQPVPDRFLDLLEKLDAPRPVETEGARK